MPLTDVHDMHFVGGLVEACASFNGTAVVCLSISGPELGLLYHGTAHRLLGRFQLRRICDVALVGRSGWKLGLAGH